MLGQREDRRYYMATYVMSDIHGIYEKYKRMLQKINFSDSDKLIIIGDVIDRGPDGIRILQDMIKRENVEIIVGNHELMMLDALELKDNIPPGIDWLGAWYRNGGRVTANNFAYLAKAEQNEIIKYLTTAQYERLITVNDKKFYIAHGGPVGCDKKNRLTDFEHNVTWNRLAVWSYVPMKDVDHVIFGHTPTSYYQGCEGEHYTIFKSYQLIGIDCGCASNNEHSRLACLRLDDMVEFYT